MPALMAVISGNSQPLQKELIAVQRMANQTSRSLESIGAGHGGSAGTMRETLVLMRELSRGNWTRVPGSITILLQRMGVLNLIFKDTASASEVLAEAWEKQAASASIAAVAATRKAQASVAAFEADAENTEATLAQAVADEEGAAAAIANANAIRSKAVAAREAANATAQGATTAIGPLGAVLGIIVAIAAGAYAAYTLSKNLVDTLSGLKVPDIHPEYIAKHLKASSQAAEGQKKINKEVERTIELYNSAASAAGRVADETKKHFEHLRKMASYEKNPAKRAQKELEIDAQERAAEIANKEQEQKNLEEESKRKKSDADAIRVSSKEEDKNNIDAKKKMADEAQKYLDDLNAAQNGGDGSIKRKLIRGYNSVALSGVSGGDLDAAEQANRDEAHRRIQAYRESVDKEAANDELRERKKQLTDDAAKSASKAAEIAQNLPQMRKNAATANSDEAEEKNAELASEKKSKMFHGHVNSLQTVGAYTSGAVHLDVARKQLVHLANIDKHISHGGHGMTGGGVGRVKY